MGGTVGGRLRGRVREGKGAPTTDCRAGPPAAGVGGPAVFSCKKYAKSVCENYCSTFYLYVVNIILP